MFVIKETTTKYRIYPACLPLQQRTATEGVHSGWSSPIPFHILTEYAPGFTKVYRDFFKQIHYKMNIQEQCRDTNLIPFLSTFPFPAEFETDTYYPPGRSLF